MTARARKAGQVSEFEFEHDGRRYRCTLEMRAGGARELWWWFSVSGDGQRYAPFEATEGEPQESVQARVIAFHAALLERRARPPETAQQAWWQRRRNGGAEPGTPSGGEETK